GDREVVRWRVNPRDSDLVSKTYRELAHDVAKMQAWLSERLPRGSRIALVGNNSYPWMVTWLAVASGFGVIVPLDRLLKPSEILPSVQRSESIMFVYDAEWHEHVNAMLDDLPALTHRVVMDRGIASEAVKRDLLSEMAEDDHLFRLDDILNTPLDLATDPEWLSPPDADGDAAILFTSGTSATSKAVILTNKSIAADIRALLGSVSFPDPLQTLSILPLHHAFENTCGFLTILAIGGTIHIADGLRYIGKNFEEHRVHLTVVVPAILDAVHRRVIGEATKTGQIKKLKMGMAIATFLYKLGIDIRRKLMKDVLEKLGGRLQYIICGAAPVDIETLKFFRAIGIEVLAGYGLTESSPVASGGNTKVNEFGTVGQPLSGVEIAIDNGGKGDGEILIRSDIVMKGYLDDPEATAEVIDENGWLHTADIGHFTRKKSLVITGRSKSMIVLSSGKKVFPEEIEALLNHHETVRDALVFGHQGLSGEIVITAKVVVNQDKLRDVLKRDPTEEELAQAVAAVIEEVNRGLPSFKGIRSYFYSLQDMVKTTTLKIRRGVELERLEDYFTRTRTSWQSLRGKNIDEAIASQDGTNLPAMEARKDEGAPADKRELKEIRKIEHARNRQKRALEKRRDLLERKKIVLTQRARKLKEIEDHLIADEHAHEDIGGQEESDL
ncbi:MAG TPA: AMP-binding protein, partial [Clostridia bacterium]|nr:AMP-binding protein [Clostridia bacterium]